MWPSCVTSYRSQKRYLVATMRGMDSYSGARRRGRGERTARVQTPLSAKTHMDHQYCRAVPRGIPNSDEKIYHPTAHRLGRGDIDIDNHYSRGVGYGILSNLAGAQFQLWGLVRTSHSHSAYQCSRPTKDFSHAGHASGVRLKTPSLIVISCARL